MKVKNITLVIFYFLFIKCGLTQCPVPYVIYPNGGEKIYNDSVIEILFDYGAYDIYRGFNLPYVYFFYSLDGGNSWVGGDSISIDTSILYNNPIIKHKWNIEGITSNNCLIKIHKYTWGCWDESDQVFSISKISTSTKEPIKKAKQASIFPNPAIKGDIIYVKNQESGNNIKNIQILDSKGRRIKYFQVKNNEASIPTNGLHSGVYYLIIDTDNSLKKRKIIIQ